MWRNGRNHACILTAMDNPVPALKCLSVPEYMRWWMVFIYAYGIFSACHQLLGTGLGSCTLHHLLPDVTFSPSALNRTKVCLYLMGTVWD